MGIKSIALATTTLILSTNINASIISYGGYTHDTTTDIVTGNGLEWLQWDRTLGESINSIQSQLNTIEGGGWAVASNVQMAELLNSFDFGLTFDSDESTSQQVSTGFTIEDDPSETDSIFISMFGDTFAASGITNQFRSKESNAYFGHELNQNLFVNSVSVAADFTENFGAQHDGNVFMSGDQIFFAFTTDTVGVALVRDVSVVPVPTAVWLFGSGLLGLIGVARRNRQA